MSAPRGQAGEFDFDGAARASGTGPDAADRERVRSVSELTREIKHSLEGFGRVAVEGEVTGIKRAAAGHMYFDLKDMDSKISCAIWRSAVASALRIDLKEGMRVVAHGKLDVYAPRGSYSLIVQRLEQRGIGELLAKLEALKQELAARGWFDRHRELPRLPRVIGVVTSRDTAAFQDFLRTRSLRWPLYPVRLAHTPVQGAAAAREISAAIARLDASGVDVIVVCRGGGSLEDLWCFNELPVAEAIWNSSVPVVTGVGHETDTTLADLVADHRAHTPTDAAQTVIPDRAALVAEIERAEGHLSQAIEGVLQERGERLERAAGARVLRDAQWILGDRITALEHGARALHHLALRHVERRSHSTSTLAARLERSGPAARVAAAHARLANLGPRLSNAGKLPHDRRERRLSVAAAALGAFSPFAVLERGYSITRRPAGAPITSSAGVQVGEELETILSSGSLSSRVESTRAGDHAGDHVGERAGEAEPA